MLVSLLVSSLDSHAMIHYGLAGARTVWLRWYNRTFWSEHVLPPAIVWSKIPRKGLDDLKIVAFARRSRIPGTANGRGNVGP